jgi:glycosyltransferase involved in cell wall biosynthesis
MNIQHYPLVTIAIPTYNRAEWFLSSAIRSAVEQTYRNLQILVSDNCSIDNTEEVVTGFKDRRILYYKHNINIGANNNFNFCVEQAKGKYFLLLHDDDLIDPDFVERCIESASGEGTKGIIRTGTRRIDGQGRVIAEQPNLVGGLSNHEFLLGWFRGRTAFYLCSTLYGTEYLKLAGGFHSPRTLFQDVASLAILASRHGRVDVPDVKASFRRHGQNMGSSAQIRSWCEDSLYLLDLMCRLEPAHKEEIRREGELFFSRGNYARAARIRSPLERIRGYWLVYTMFGKRLSPPAHFTSRKVRRLKQHLREMLRTALGRTGAAALSPRERFGREGASPSAQGRRRRDDQ